MGLNVIFAAASLAAGIVSASLQEASETQITSLAEPELVIEDELPPLPPPPPPPPAPPPEPEIVWSGPIAICVAKPPSSIPAAIVREMEQTLQEAANKWNEISIANIIVGFDSDDGSCIANADEISENSTLSIKIGRAEGATSSEVDLRRFGFNNVRAKLIDGASQFSATDRLGSRLAEGGIIEFRTLYGWNDKICGINSIAGAAQCRFSDAVHEFGHLLGFSHDHVSINAPPCVNLFATNENMLNSMTYYDPKSLMNYCNEDRWRAELSEADICSTQVRYPRPGTLRRREGDCYLIAQEAMDQERSSPASN